MTGRTSVAIDCIPVIAGFRPHCQPIAADNGADTRGSGACVASLNGIAIRTAPVSVIRIPIIAYLSIVLWFDDAIAAGLPETLGWPVQTQPPLTLQVLAM